MDMMSLVFIVVLAVCSFAEIERNEYAGVSEQLMVTPTSAAMAGSDLSIGNGATVESTPANLPFDSLNRLSLSYAGFFGNVFSSSMLTYSGKIQDKTGISLLLGYLYFPDIPNTLGSTVADDGSLMEVKITNYAASKIIFRAGVGRSILIHPKMTLSGGIALNAQRARLPETGYGIGMDLGIKSFFPRTGISLALQLENATSSYMYWNKNYKEGSYQHLRAGIGWERNLQYLYGRLRLSYATPDLFADEGINSYAKTTNDKGESADAPDHYEVYEKPSLLFSQGKIGLEYVIMRMVALRFGITQGMVSFGAGLHLMKDRTGLDFAYITHALGGTYQLSVFYNW